MFDQSEMQQLRDVFGARHRALAASLQGEASLSGGAEKKAERLLIRRKKIYYSLVNTAVKRAACLAGAVVLMGSAVTLGVASLQGRDADFSVERYENGATVCFRADERVPFVAKHPTYLPAGYTLIRDQSEADETYLLYEGAGSDFFCFAQYPSGDQASFYLGTQSYERITLAEEYEAIYIQNGAYSCLLFTEGDFMYLINGNLPREELLAVAASVFSQSIET
ncbi:MAG: DUF4367 domain-containing protein [Clostridia bacterium]|nr:DUF4367 domain-containing protein [Clostridia bacterium]